MITNKTELRIEMNKRGLTQRKLAQLSGISIRTIRDIEQGYSKGNENTWMKLNKVFYEMEVKFIYEDVKDMTLKEISEIYNVTTLEVEVTGYCDWCYQDFIEIKIIVLSENPSEDLCDEVEQLYKEDEGCPDEGSHQIVVNTDKIKILKII